MTRIITKLLSRRASKILFTALAGAGICVLVPSVASARGYDRGERYHDAREWRHDRDDYRGHHRDHGHDDVRLDIGVIGGIPPVYHEPQRVWVPPVYRTVCDRVWVEPEYRTVTERVWREPVTRDVCDRVWVEPTYESHDRVWFDHRGGRHVETQRFLVNSGHWEEQHRTVVISEGHYEDVPHQELVCEGHWQNVERQELVTPGHWEEPIARVDDRPHWSIGFEIGGH